MITDAVKAIDGTLELDVLGMPHGVDREGQVFDAQTDLGGASEIPVVAYHGYDELGAAKVDYIGTATRGKRDDAGQWFRVSLDAAKLKAQQIYADATKGLVRASSDAIAHLVRPYGILGKAGRVSSWPIAALSLMDAETSKRAINPGAIAIPAMKAYLVELEALSGEAAAKSGATFAKRNRDRIAAIKRELDDMINEFGDEKEQSAAGEQPAAKGGKMEAENKGTSLPLAGDGNLEHMKDWERSMGAILAESERKSREYFDSQFGKHETAVKAAFDAKLEATTTASQRPQFGGVSASENPAAAKAASVERESAAYRHWIRTNTVQPDWAAAKAAINEGTSSQGGYLVPTLYSNDLVTITYLNSVLRDAGARTIKVTGTNSFRVPTLTNSTAAVLTAEAAGFDEQEPTFAEIAFVPYKYTALAKASREAVDDSRIDVAGIVNDDANYRFVLAENIAFTTGTGSSQPQGIVIGATNGTTCASVSAITADEVIGHFHTVGYQYRNSPTFGWMMNDATVAYVRKMKDTANNYLWLNPSGAVGGGFTGPMQPTLLGKPVFTNNSMASALTTGQKLILAGDFRYFWIADFAQTEVQQLRELYAANGQIGYVFNKRIDAHVVLAAALQYLKLA